MFSGIELVHVSSLILVKLHLYELKAIAADKSESGTNETNFFDWVEKIVLKVENTGHNLVLVFPATFSKSFFSLLQEITPSLLHSFPV